MPGNKHMNPEAKKAMRKATFRLVSVLAVLVLTAAILIFFYWRSHTEVSGDKKNIVTQPDSVMTKSPLPTSSPPPSHKIKIPPPGNPPPIK